jgi:hypothetical protein
MMVTPARKMKFQAPDVFIVPGGAVMSRMAGDRSGRFFVAAELVPVAFGGLAARFFSPATGAGRIRADDLF